MEQEKRKLGGLLRRLFGSRKVTHEQEPQEPKPEEKKSEEEWVREGGWLAEIQDWEEALACFDRALELNPRYVDAWNEKGVALAKSDRHEDALVCFDRALEINPRNEQVWSNKGEVLGADLGRWEEAMACCDRRLELNPFSADAWADKRMALYRLGRREGERYSNADVWKGDALAPQTSVDRALELNPRDDWAWFKKGSELIELAHREEALRRFERALELVNEAVACFDRVRELNPGNEWIKNNKSEALRFRRGCYYALACFAPKGKFRVVGVSEWRMSYYGMAVEGNYDTPDEALTIARQSRNEGCWVYDDQGMMRYAEWHGQEERSNAWEYV